MLTTIIYRSHLHDDAPPRALENTVTTANLKNRRSDVTGILLFNDRHFFQLLEGPEEQIKEIYRCICNDPRHHNIVELMCDYAPARRFGKVGMGLSDLQKRECNDVLQAVLNRGTSKFQLTYDDRALQFFRASVLATEKSSYLEIPVLDYWSFITDNSCNLLDESTLPSNIDSSFAFQPIIDPMSQRVTALEALIRGRDGEAPAAYFDSLNPEELYTANLRNKKTAFAMASALELSDKMLSVNLPPMTLVNKPDAVSFLINEIAAYGLVPGQIIVEFTESEVISRFDTFAQAVKSLKATGIRVAIDHFGAGFAGLQFLSRFQPDRTKISRELITDVHKSGSRQVIIQTIIKCCTPLEITISAVGVEKPEEWMRLESVSIEIFQGNLFAQAYLNGIPSVAWLEKDDFPASK